MLQTLLLSLCLSASAEERSFGGPVTSTETVTLADTLARPGSYKGREVVLEGVVRDVCKKKGCWMVLDDGERDLRITFKDYAFFVPKDAGGKRVRCQGEVLRETVSVKTQRHYLKDAGASKAEIKAVKEPKDAVSFVASGVLILD